MGIFSALFGADFTPAKCKTSLRLCLGRVKLLKNKKRVALQALRREIAELMRAGKYDSARVRVEGVLREEAMLERSRSSTSSEASRRPTPAHLLHRGPPRGSQGGGRHRRVRRDARPSSPNSPRSAPNSPPRQAFVAACAEDATPPRAAWPRRPRETLRRRPPRNASALRRRRTRRRLRRRRRSSRREPRLARSECTVPTNPTPFVRHRLVRRPRGVIRRDARGDPVMAARRSYGAEARAAADAAAAWPAGTRASRTRPARAG